MQRSCRNCCTGNETKVWGDQAYRGQHKVIHACAPRVKIARTNGSALRRVDEVEREKNRVKAKVRAKVEHVLPSSN